MSRYSPTVLPVPAPSWAEALGPALRMGVEMYQLVHSARAAKHEQNLRDFQQGVRQGTAPDEPTRSVTLPSTRGIDAIAEDGRADFRTLAPSLMQSETRAPSVFDRPPSPSSSPMESGALLEHDHDRGPLSQPASPGYDRRMSIIGGDHSAKARALPEPKLTPGRYNHERGGFDSALPPKPTSEGETLTWQDQGAPRYEQIDRKHYIDNTATPDARAERRQYGQTDFSARLAESLRGDRAAGDRSRKASAYVAAGMTPEQAAAAVEDPTLGDRFLGFTGSHGGQPPVQTQVHQRVTELVAGGLSLDDAAKRARLEYGFAGAQPRVGRAPVNEARQDLPIFNRGVTEATGALHAAERRVPKRPAVFLTQEAENRYPADSAHAADAVRIASQRVEQARHSRDSVATEAIRFGRPGTSQQTPTESPDALYQEAADAYREAVQHGTDPHTARATYDRVVQGIARRFGKIK